MSSSPRQPRSQLAFLILFTLLIDIFISIRAFVPTLGWTRCDHLPHEMIKQRTSVGSFLPKFSQCKLVRYSSVQEQESSSSPSMTTDNKTNGGGRVPPGKGIRAQRLKDLLLDKEFRNDISTAEFALTLDMPRISEIKEEASMKGKGGLIDYEKIAEKLEKNLELIDRREGRMAAASLRKEGGEESIEKLTLRLNDTRAELKNVLRRVKESMKGSAPGAASSSGSSSNARSSTTASADESSPEKALSNPLTVFVREDGTVDWDGAIQSGKDLAKFSGEVLERLQGKSPGEESASSPRVANLVAIDTSPSIQALHELLRQLESEFRSAEAERNKISELHKALRRQGLEVTKAQKGELRIAEDQLIEMRRRVELQRLDVDMERICAYIEQEIEQSTSIREQKLLVAEFGLLDAQLGTLLSMLQDSELDTSSLLELDEEELNVVASEVQDLKTRLGLVEDQGGNKLDWSMVNSYVQESVGKVRQGVSFYINGAKILASDLQYAGWLISRAAQGYTLKPREVRTLQRTAKDLLTLIPFTIILIIPLTPVGHVLIFSLIQRIFPDFFPSTFTERRQNLSKMYDEIEKKPFIGNNPSPPPANH